jgi:hypothetical protein
MTDSFYTQAEQDKMDALENDGIVVNWLSGSCPVQGDGWIDGHAFYFRARGDQWSIEVTDHIVPETSGIWKFQTPPPATWGYGEDYGDFPDAGYMPFIEALGFIEQSAASFRKYLAE